MRVIVRHGHFAFYPRDDKDLGRFQLYFEQALEPEEDYYTFPFLLGAPRYSLQGAPWLSIPALASYEGTPWQVMRENSLVYHIALGIVVPYATITDMVKLPAATYYAIAQKPLIQPGCLMLTGDRILSYDAEFIQDWQQLRIRSIGYE